MSEYRFIPLHGKYGEGKFAKVDLRDFDRLVSTKWHLNNAGVGYVVHYFHTYKNGVRKTKCLLMHQMALEVTTPVDHVDGDPLNNTRKNLRSCDHQQNMMNRKSHKGSSSQFKGVYWETSRQKWRAAIRVNGKRHSLGYYLVEVEAASAYNQAALTYHGEFARLNQI